MNQECADLSYLTHNSIDALTCQAISDKEWVLVFARKSISPSSPQLPVPPTLDQHHLLRLQMSLWTRETRETIV